MVVKKYKGKPGTGRRNIFHLITWNQWVFGDRSLSAPRIAKANRLKGIDGVIARTDSIPQKRSIGYCQSCNCPLTDHLPSDLHPHSLQLQMTVPNLTDPEAHIILCIYFKESDLQSNYITNVFCRKEWYNHLPSKTSQ